MPAHARKDIVREGEIATYHCWSRCVQRARLCGDDPLTGIDFDYRRGWIESLLAYLAGVFAVDVGNYNVLSNHLHSILRTRPDLTLAWPAEEVALRWKLAWPELVDGQWQRNPSDRELDELLAQPEKIAQIRRNLSSLSWFMARWKEPIARICNAEMESSGHFWEARFKCRELLDDEAVLTCSIYVDLNQVRAGMATSLGASRHSAIQQRILSAKAREAQQSWEDVRGRYAEGGAPFSLAEAQSLFADCWLSPIAADGPLITAESVAAVILREDNTSRADLARQAVAQVAAEVADHADLTASDAAVTTEAVGASPVAAPESSTTNQPEAAPGADEPAQAVVRLRPQLTRRRASDAPFIAVPWGEYLRVAQVLARRALSVETMCLATPHEQEDGTEDAALRETLSRWGMNPAAWLTELHRLDLQCTRVLGTARHVLRRAQAVAQQRFHGIRLCREIFASATAQAFT